MVLLVALQAVLKLVLAVVLNPIVLLALILTGTLALLAFVLKVGWAVAFWPRVVAVLNEAWKTLEGDPVAICVLGLLCSVDMTIGLIAVGGYVVARKLNIKVGG